MVDADAWYNKGNALLSIAKTMDALICYNHVLEIDPMKLGALYNKALLEYTLGRTHDAILSYKRFIEIAPRDDSQWLENARKKLKELEGK